MRLDDSKYRDVYIKSVSQIVAEKDNLKGALSAEGNVTPTAIAQVQGKVSTLKTKKKLKVRVVEVGSDTLNFNNENKKAIFRGNVIVNTEDIRILCTELDSENYQQDAEAKGNVSVVYKKQGMKMTCKYMKYKDNLNNVTAYENVYATKILPDGNTLTMHADEVNFNTREQTLTAYKKDKKVKIELKDLVAFSEKVVYNENDKKIYMTGEPIVRKKSSYFLSDVIVLDTLSKLFVMKNSIWSKLFYKEFEETNKELVSENSKNLTPRKNIQ
ncbi:MAG: LptA/OstA family protein [bacterium]